MTRPVLFNWLSSDVGVLLGARVLSRFHCENELWEDQEWTRRVLQEFTECRLCWWYVDDTEISWGWRTFKLSRSKWQCLGMVCTLFGSHQHCWEVLSRWEPPKRLLLKSLPEEAGAISEMEKVNFHLKLMCLLKGPLLKVQSSGCFLILTSAKFACWLRTSNASNWEFWRTC